MANCIFCEIVGKKIPSEIIQERKDFIVIKDIAPKAPFHFLLIPKKHFDSLFSLTGHEHELFGGMIDETKLLAERFGLSERGYRVVINCGPEGGQVVQHLHLHFLGGKKFSD